MLEEKVAKSQSIITNSFFFSCFFVHFLLFFSFLLLLVAKRPKNKIIIRSPEEKKWKASFRDDANVKTSFCYIIVHSSCSQYIIFCKFFWPSISQRLSICARSSSFKVIPFLTFRAIHYNQFSIIIII
jgi:hypothetical protein